MILDELRSPVVLAPMAGGPSTPELAAAVSQTGGLGFLASGYHSATELNERLATMRRLDAAPFGVNVFVPELGPADPTTYASYVERLEVWARQAGVTLGEPTFSDDDWRAKLELLTRQPVAVVSFTFGCPSAEVMGEIRATGAEAWVTITNPDEARQAAQAGADALIVQGAEAGGHRGSFADHLALPIYGLLPLLQLVRASVSLPLVAAGGIATPAAVAAVLSAGASAAQVGTAFMLSPEAGTSPAHRAALRSSERTVLTRAFTGRLARGIPNGFILEHESHAVAAYPELHYLTAPMRAQARAAGDPHLMNLWAGEAHALAEELPAAEIVRRLTPDLEIATHDP